MDLVSTQLPLTFFFFLQQPIIFTPYFTGLFLSFAPMYWRHLFCLTCNEVRKEQEVFFYGMKKKITTSYLFTNIIYSITVGTISFSERLYTLGYNTKVTSFAFEYVVYFFIDSYCLIRFRVPLYDRICVMRTLLKGNSKQ